jgi:hypothetical protein
VATVIDQQTTVKAAPAVLFDFLHDPARRREWDSTVDGADLEGELGTGGRLHLHGHRKAPSWTGEYRVYERPRRSELVFLEGVGMPFRSYVQTIEVKPAKGGSTVRFRIEYELPAVLALIDAFTFRGKLARAARNAMSDIAVRFGQPG